MNAIATTGRRWLLDVAAGGLLALALALVYAFDGWVATRLPDGAPLPESVAHTSSLLDGDASVPSAAINPAAPPTAPDPTSPPADRVALAPQPWLPVADDPPLAANKEITEKPGGVAPSDFAIVGMAEPPKPVVTEKVLEALMTGSKLNKFGNPEGKDVGLAATNEFAGARILVWSADPEVHGLIFTAKNPLWAALREKGFDVRLERQRFEPDWLTDVAQVWIFAGQTSGMDAQSENAIVAFVEQGKGMYLVADNAPFLVEATHLAERLYHAQISGNFQGENLIAVRGHGVTRADYRKSQSGKQSGAQFEQRGERISVINRATHYAEEHPLLTDVNFIYEGITISHISSSPALHTVLRASDGQILAAVALDRRQRVVVDCGYTRYGYTASKQFITETAGTLRYAENIAAYLMGKDDKRSRWTTWRDRRELMVKYRERSQQEILTLLQDTNPDKRWAATAAAAQRKLEIPAALVELLRDEDADIREQARSALRQLAEGADYGPAINATAKNREIAYQNWRGWLTRIQLSAKCDTLDESAILAAMTDANPVQRWAAVSSARRRKLDLPDALIARLLDEISEIREEAHRALVRLSGGTDFGPAPQSSAAERQSAVVEWQRWRLPRKFPALTHADEVEVLRAMRSQDDDQRWAAVLVVRQRKLQPTSALVELLADRQPPIQQEARQALAQLSKHDFGPEQGATAAEVAAAQARWTDWWKEKDEQKAGRDLKLAKLLLERDRPEARRRLQRIVAAHPGTDAAVEAKQLLDLNP